MHEVWVSLQGYSRLRATRVHGIFGDRYARRQQHGDKELLFDLGRSNSLQNGLSLDATCQCVGMPGLVAPAVTEPPISGLCGPSPISFPPDALLGAPIARAKTS